MSGKAVVDIKNQEQWDSHVNDYGTKLKNKEKMTKVIILDLGISVYEREKRVVLLATTNKRSAAANQSNLDSSNQQPSKKKKSNNIFTAPKSLIVQVLNPVEFDTESKVCKTSSVDPLGSTEIDFNKYVVGRLENNENS